MNPDIRKKILASATICVAGAFSFMLVIGCTATGGGSATASGTTAGSSAPISEAEGKRLYYTRCTSCHAAEPVDYYTRDEWASMVDHMRKRAKLKPHEEASLLLFLNAHAAQG